MKERALSIIKKPYAVYERYERHIGTAALVLGFVLDNLTLTRIDLGVDNLIIISYLFIAIAGVIAINLYEGQKVRGRVMYYVRSFAPVPIQFAFGGLFSSFTVFYSRSASISSSWFFILILLAALIGNEFFRGRYSRFTFQMSILFVAIFLYAVFAVPIAVGSMGARIFLLSGAVSLAVIFALVFFLSLVMPGRVGGSKNALARSISVIFIAFNALYFLNIIPPIPLSLKEAGIYHSVARNGKGEYVMKREKLQWFEKFMPRWAINLAGNERAYFYSAVFAPTRLNAVIVHNWQKYDSSAGEWKTVSKMNYPITGGRDGGYRGYSFRSSVTPGLWRVNVETERGQRLGRVKFDVNRVDKPVFLETVIR